MRNAIIDNLALRARARHGPSRNLRLDLAVLSAATGRCVACHSSRSRRQLRKLVHQARSARAERRCERLAGVAERLGAADARLEVKRTQAPAARSRCRAPEHERALDAALAQLPALPIAGVGHRVVHGGEAFSEQRGDRRDARSRRSRRAPISRRCTIPPNLSGIRDALRLLPDVEHVAVFDTAFHQTMPRARVHVRAAVSALRAVQGAQVRLPRHEPSLRRAARRRSCSAPAARAQPDLGAPRQRRERDRGRGGRSVDTTMGLTPLEGLVMGTRSGDVDPESACISGRARSAWSSAGVSDLLNETERPARTQRPEQRHAHAARARTRRATRARASRSRCSAIGWPRRCSA